MGAGSSSSSEGWKGMDRVDEKAHTSPQKQKILMDLYKAYARTDHIGKSRTRDFARDLVRWHVKKKHLRGDDIDVKKEVYRIINFFDVGREGRIYKGALLTQVGGQVLLNYNFNHTYNRRRTQHVLQATMHDILGKKEVEIILSYTQEWGHHKGAYIGYGVKNGYWRNGWGWDTFNTATPHKSHARSHGRKGDGLSHWSCCGNVDKFDKFCYNYSIPLVQPPSPLSSSSSAAAAAVPIYSSRAVVADPPPIGPHHHHHHHHHHHSHRYKAAVAVGPSSPSSSSSSRANNSQVSPPENEARLSPIVLPRVARKVTPSSRTDDPTPFPEPLQAAQAVQVQKHHHQQQKQREPSRWS